MEKINNWIILAFLVVTTVLPAFGKIESPSTAKSKPPTVVVMYTGKGAEAAQEYENLTDVTRFAFDQYQEETGTKFNVKLVTVDDQDNPEYARKLLKKVVDEEKPLAIVGPIYSNVALGLKDYINEAHVPMVSIFATHNDLTKNSQYIFRICASNRRLVKSMADFLIPEVQKNGLNITAFKDLSDDYSVDLADAFRVNIQGVKTNYNEVLFRGLTGIEKLRDLNAKLWSPTKKDILFFPTRDIIAGKVLAAMESYPYLVAAIDTVNFQHLMKRVKSQKSHFRLVTTSQWIPGKSEFSKKIEAAFLQKFKRPMTISSALTFDAAYTVAAAYQRAQAKGLPVATTLRDATKVTGVTGVIILGTDGERVFSDQFLKEEIIE